MQTIQLDTLTLYPKAPSPLTGKYIVNSVEGWYSLPESKTDSEDRVNEHGAFSIGMDWRASAAITIKGWYNGSQRSECLQAKSILNAIGGRGAMVPVTIIDEQGQTTRMVSIRQIDIDDDHGQTWFNYAMDLLATDPRRYSPETSVSIPSRGGNLLANGTFDTDTSGWTVHRSGAADTTLTRKTDSPRSGTGYGSYTAAAANDLITFEAFTNTVHTAGVDSYVVWVKTSAARSAALTVTALAANNDHLVTWTQDVDTLAGYWTRILIQTGDDLPAATSKLSVAVDFPNVASGEVLSVDDALASTTPTLSYPFTTFEDLPQVAVTNHGTADTRPVVIFTAGQDLPSGFSVVEINEDDPNNHVYRRISWNSPLNANDQITLDFNIGMALLNGAPAPGLWNTDWPLVPAGKTRIYTINTFDGIGLMEVRSKDAWW